MLPEDTLSRLDAQRGLIPRSSYIRALIAQSLDVEEDIEGLWEVPLMEETPARMIKVVPEQQHRHRFERREQIGHQMRGSLQVPVYRYECGSPICDEYQERP